MAADRSSVGAAIVAIPLGWLIGHTGRGRELAVGISGAAAAFPFKEHEPLRPVAIGILLAENAAEQISNRFKPAECEQELQWSLADIAGSPAATGILFEPAR